ncbi:tyrosine-type recombinase/integrase [Hyphobacterium sp. HN65]|uniref:Tyrosine-type recombinase/integrase n=1 Tax=Hyphobacterium lacteum TaxID=3116575 RepID=A0ABU7LT64_9PROT|nr:tyrosine-type recombinase/integrase [Hyphobacterium sp. HN65]MEE2527112.1 tyrosine-type recombinase/integrase [Hyphobacterium sp. HN65]
MKTRLNKKFCDAVTVKARADFADAIEDRLYLRVTPKGAKTWSFLYYKPGSGRRCRLLIGHYPALLPEDARKAVREAKRLLDRGDDPATQKINRASLRSFADLANLYMERHSRPLKRSWARDQEYLDRDILPAIGELRIDRITRSDVLSVIDRIEERRARTQAERVYACLRGIFRWGLSQDYINRDPTAGIKRRPRMLSRTRYLTLDEIHRLWWGMEEGGFQASTKLALKLALITGQRIGEVCGIRLDELDLARACWVIPGARTKNRLEHEVPLSDLALELIREAIDDCSGETFLFAFYPKHGDQTGAEQPLTPHAAARALNRKLKDLGFAEAPFTPHDLRRTIATHLQREGYPEAVLARLLNHSSDTARTVTAGVYMRHAYTIEKRDAANRWAEIIRDAVNVSPVIEISSNRHTNGGLS